jgi:hypothetical protein
LNPPRHRRQLAGVAGCSTRTRRQPANSSCRPPLDRWTKSARIGHNRLTHGATDTQATDAG